MAKFGSLRKLPSGRWQARYTDHTTGRMISAPDTFRTKSVVDDLDRGGQLVGIDPDDDSAHGCTRALP